MSPTETTAAAVAAFLAAVIAGVIRKLRAAKAPSSTDTTGGDVPRALARDLEIHRALEDWRQDLGLDRLILFCVHNGGQRITHAGSQLYATVAGEAKAPALRYVAPQWVRRPIYDLSCKDMLRDLFARKSAARTLTDLAPGAPLRETFAPDGEAGAVVAVEVLDDLGHYWYALATSTDVGRLDLSTQGRLAGAAAQLRPLLLRPL